MQSSVLLEVKDNLNVLWREEKEGKVVSFPNSTSPHNGFNPYNHILF